MSSVKHRYKTWRNGYSPDLLVWRDKCPAWAVCGRGVVADCTRPGVSGRAFATLAMALTSADGITWHGPACPLAHF